MTYNPQLWKRYEFNRLPIYVRTDRPTWFVPNRSGDKLLKLSDKQSDHLYREKFLNRLPDTLADNYSGRYHHLKTDQLKELWLHITNRCNL
ncbi:MAG: hypothetical protein QNK27_02720, partial [Desulfuromusa sp.]|nr:hypothetical protein [Desulfuromusa sp.]